MNWIEIIIAYMLGAMMANIILIIIFIVIMIRDFDVVDNTKEAIVNLSKAYNKFISDLIEVLRIDKLIDYIQKKI